MAFLMWGAHMQTHEPKLKKLSYPHDHYCARFNITPTSPTLVCNEGGTDAYLESPGPGIPQRFSINCPKAEIQQRGKK